MRTETLAAVARLSGSHFARACKNTLGVSPKTLVMRRRVQRAQALMLQSRDTLCQIALACGFADQPHFSRVFRQVADTTPQRWRQQHALGV